MDGRRLILVAVLAAACAAAGPRASAAPRDRGGPAAAAPLRAPLARVSALGALAAETVEAIAEAVRGEMSRLGVPGLSLAVGGGGEIRLETAFGWADVENEVKATPDTVYRLASVSKPMTAAAVLRLAAQGRLDLDAPVWRYCPAFPPKPWPVTARQLLAHQGGVRTYRPGEMTRTRRFASVAEGLALFAEDPLVHEPGTAVVYTTYGYVLLGCAAEGAAGQPFDGVLRELVLEPTGMANTRPESLRRLVPRRARGYARGPAGELSNSALSDVSYKVPGGGLVGTAPDVARFGLALLSRRLVAPPELEQMLAPQRLRTGGPTGFGLGLAVGRRGGRREASHIGGQEQVSTVVYLRPDSGTVVAILTNLENVQEALLDVARRVSDLAEAERVYR